MHFDASNPIARPYNCYDCIDRRTSRRAVSAMTEPKPVTPANVPELDPDIDDIENDTLDAIDDVIEADPLDLLREDE